MIIKSYWLWGAVGIIKLGLYVNLTVTYGSDYKERSYDYKLHHIGHLPKLIIAKVIGEKGYDFWWRIQHNLN